MPTLTPTPIPVAHSGAQPRWLRPVLWGVMALNLSLIAFQLVLYPALLAMPDGWSFVLAPVVLLAIYAGVVLALPIIVAHVSGGAGALIVGTRIGLVAAVIEALNISLESLVAMPQAVTAVVTGIFMLSAFALWGTVGMLVAHRTQSVVSGALAAVWSAIITMLLAVTYGFALLALAWPQLAAFEATDPDFLRSHWDDLHAFTIANTFSNGATHFVEAPLIAFVVGGLGASIGKFLATARAVKAAAH